MFVCVCLLNQISTYSIDVFGVELPDKQVIYCMFHQRYSCTSLYESRLFDWGHSHNIMFL